MGQYALTHDPSTHCLLWNVQSISGWPATYEWGGQDSCWGRGEGDLLCVTLPTFCVTQMGQRRSS